MAVAVSGGSSFFAPSLFSLDHVCVFGNAINLKPDINAIVTGNSKCSAVVRCV